LRLKPGDIGILQREQRFEVRIQSLNSSACAGYLQFGHTTIPLPLSPGSFGKLKQKIHLKSSSVRYEALGLYFLRSRTFAAGLTLVARVVFVVLVFVCCLFDVGVVLDDWVLDLVVRVVVLVDGGILVVRVVRALCVWVGRLVKLLILLVRSAMYSRVNVGIDGLVLVNPKTISIKIIAMKSNRRFKST